MKNRAAHRVLLVTMLVLAGVVFSGCIRRLSEPVYYTTVYDGVSQFHLSNAVGKTLVIGDTEHTDQVTISTELRVETYSLFGLSDPNRYLGYVDTVEILDEDTGVLTISASLTQRSFGDRLFVRVLPYVERSLEAPTAIGATFQSDVGNLDLLNLVGDIDAEVRVGELSVTSYLGIFGRQEHNVNVGTLNITLPHDAAFRYDLKTSVGNIESTGFSISPEGFIGASASGATRPLDANTPSSIIGRVDVGNIVVKAQ